MDWFYIIAFSLTFIFSFALGIFTILQNYKSKVHWLWFLTSMGVAMWAFGSIASAWFSTNKEWSLIYFKLLDSSALLLMCFYLHFVIEFLNLSNRYKLIIFINYLLSIIFVFLIYSTNWVVAGVVQRLNFNYWEIGGTLYSIYFIYCLIVFLICLNFQIKGYKNSEGLKKRQLQYLIAAVCIGFGGGLTTFLPALFNIYPFGAFVVFLYPLLITKGIFLEKD